MASFRPLGPSKWNSLCPSFPAEILPLCGRREIGRDSRREKKKRKKEKGKRKKKKCRKIGRKGEARERGGILYSLCRAQDGMTRTGISPLVNCRRNRGERDLVSYQGRYSSSYSETMMTRFERHSSIVYFETLFALQLNKI